MKHAPPTELAALYMEVVPKAMREYRREMRQARGTCLSVPQFRILAQLHTDPANIRTLAEFQGVSVAAMSRMVDWLCKHGLVERFTDARDLRHVHVRLTKTGCKRFKKVRKEARSRLQRRLNDLDPQQRAKLKTGLASLLDIVRHLGTGLEAIRMA